MHSSVAKGWMDVNRRLRERESERREVKEYIEKKSFSLKYSIGVLT